MSDTDQKSSKFSLKGEIQKRKTQELARQIEERKAAAARGEGQLGAVDPRRTTQTTPAVRSGSVAPKQAPQTVDPRRTTQARRAVKPSSHAQSRSSLIPKLTRGQKSLLIAGTAAILIVFVCMGTTAIIADKANVTPTLAPLPIVSASNVIAYLKKVDVPITGDRELAIPAGSWRASQEIEFKVRRADKSGLFIILSYKSSDHKITDIFRASGRLKNWKMLDVANILMFVSPDSEQGIREEISSHIIQYLLAPYRPFLPTATPLHAQ